MKHSICRIIAGLSDHDAYELDAKFGNFGFPKWTAREYHSPTTHAYSHFPEGATLTHVKVGELPLEPLTSLDQLKGIDPSATLVYILYGEGGLV